MAADSWIIHSLAWKTKLVKDVSLFAWLLKDLGWVLVCAPVCLPAAFVAIAAESWGLRSEWASASSGIRVHGIAELLWLIGNAVWATAELLYEPMDPKEFIFPWVSGPLLASDEQRYNLGSRVALGFFLTGLAALAGFYAFTLAIGARSSVENQGEARNELPPERERVFGGLSMELYTRIFIGPWIAKDAFWILDFPVCTLLCGAIVLVLVMDYMRRAGQLHFAAELLWACGNIIWGCTELVLKDNLPLRLLAAAFLAAGLVATVASGASARLQKGAEERNGEHRTLVAKGLAAASLSSSAQAPRQG
mmetsp:Transcript_67777/g.176052  ORF Transcript_67777/g.176052 Transcript_67777/m.176052 type:complete len:307 (+) Transcript_67777:113-1033(+)